MSYITRRKIKFIIINILIFLTIGVLLLSILRIYAEKPIILWWTPFILGDDRRIVCPSGTTCLISNNKSLLNTSNISAVIFYGSSLNLSDLPLPKRIPWAIYHEESPKNLALFTHKTTQNIFKYTSTISRHSDLPVTLQYLKNSDMLLNNRFYTPIHAKNEYLKTLAPILYLQSDCDTPINRDAFVKELGRFIEIDSYGACLTNKSLPDHLIFSNNLIDFYGDDLMRFVSRYKFTIAIENAQCYDYVSEKYWRSLIVGSVPIYKGAPNIKDWFINDFAAILIDDFATVQQLADYIYVVNNDDDLYAKYITHKIDGAISNDLLDEFMRRGSYGVKGNYDDDHAVYFFECLICEDLYNNVKKSHGKNVYECLEPINRNWEMHWINGKLTAEKFEELISL